MNARACLGSAHERVGGRPVTLHSSSTRTRSHVQTWAHLWLPQRLCAKADEADGTKARPGSLETSSTTLPCDLEQKKWTWVRDGIGMGMQAGMRGKVSAKFGARLQLTLATITLTSSAA